MEEELEKKIIDSGAQERWRDILQSRLFESGWRKEVRNLCKEVVKNDSNISVDNMAKEVIPKASALVPEEIKSEIYNMILAYLQREVSTLPLTQ